MPAQDTLITKDIRAVLQRMIDRAYAEIGPPGWTGSIMASWTQSIQTAKPGAELNAVKQALIIVLSQAWYDELWELQARPTSVFVPPPPPSTDPTGGGAGDNGNGGQPDIDVEVGEMGLGLLLGGGMLVASRAALLPFLFRSSPTTLTFLASSWPKIGWVLRQALQLAGFKELTDIVFSGSEEDADAIVASRAVVVTGGPLTGLAGLPIGVTVVKEWVAGGVPFYRFSNGLQAALKKDGVWKVWRPRSPIVLYPGVGNDRRQIMRAARVVRGEVKAWRQMEKFFAPRVTRAAKKAPKIVVMESGRGGVQVLDS
jgi:hypothetical protein